MSDMTRSLTPTPTLPLEKGEGDDFPLPFSQSERGRERVGVPWPRMIEHAGNIMTS